MRRGVVIQALKRGNQPLGAGHIQATGWKKKIDLGIDVEESRCSCQIPAGPLDERGQILTVFDGVLMRDVETAQFGRQLGDAGERPRTGRAGIRQAFHKIAAKNHGPQQRFGPSAALSGARQHIAVGKAENLFGAGQRLLCLG